MISSKSLAIVTNRVKSGEPISFHVNARNGGQHCLVSMDSDLEAFSRNPTRGSVAALPFQ